MGFGSITKAVFGGGNDGYGYAKNWQNKQEKKRKSMLAQNDVKYGFGNTNEALRNNQRIDASAQDRGQNVFNAGMQRASAGFGADNSAIRQNQSATGMTNSSFAQQQKEQALNRYHSTVGQSVAMQDSAANDYNNMIGATRLADQNVINNRQVADVSQQYLDRGQLRSDREGAPVGAITNTMSDVSSGFGFGG